MQDPLLNVAPYQAQAATMAMPDPVRSRFGFAYPRWPFLAAVILNMFCIFGYLLWRFAPRVVGSPSLGGLLDDVAGWPGVAQFFALWGLFLIGWLFSFIFGYGALEGRRRPAFLVSASNFEPVRWLLAVYAGFVTLAALAMLVSNEFQAFPLALASIAIFVTVWVFIRRPRRPAQQGTAQEQRERGLARSIGPLYVFRSLPLMRGIWPPRPPRNQAAAGPAAPGVPPPLNAPRP